MGLTKNSLIVLYQKLWVSNPKEEKLGIILKKKFTWDLQHNSRSTFRHRSHTFKLGSIKRNLYKACKIIGRKTVYLMFFIGLIT